MGMIVSLTRVSADELENCRTHSSVAEGLFHSGERRYSGKIIDIDKAWDAIAYLLTGDGIAGLSEPGQGFYTNGNILDTEQDFGYGPGHVTELAEIASLNQKLQSFTKKSLREKYDGEKMSDLGLYPGCWEDDEEGFAYLYHHFQKLQSFYAKAAENNEAILSIIS